VVRNVVKLYYAPGACSLSPHIVAREARLAIDLVRVDTKTHRVEDGRDFYEVNPRGYVPVLELDDGDRLYEGAAILQFLADGAQ
jgi:glutathione S-transferase